MASQESIDKESAPHYVWGSGCDGWRLLTAEGLAVIEERIPPGESEVRHYHEKALQFFYVLSGVLSFEIDGRELNVMPRQGIEIAPTIPHRVFNRTNEDVEFLIVSCPPSHGDRVLSDKT